MATHASNADLAEQHLIQESFLGLQGLQTPDAESAGFSAF